MRVDSNLFLCTQKGDSQEYGWYTKTQQNSYTKEDIRQILEELNNQFTNAKYKQIGVEYLSNNTYILGYFGIDILNG